MTRHLRTAPPRRRLGWLLLALAAGALVFALRGPLGGRSAARSFEQAQVLFARGGLSDLRLAADELAALGGRGAPCLRAAEALARAQLWAEYGAEADAARAAVDAAADERETCLDAAVAGGLVALAAGDLPAAAEADARARRFTSATTLARQHRAWLTGGLALAGRGEPAAAIAELQAALSEQPAAIAPRRLLAWLNFQTGDHGAALEALGRARAAGRAHLGLAADEALLNSALRRELSGVADLADQLLAMDPALLGPRDRAHALLARAVVHVHAGESGAGLARLDEAWPLLPRDDLLSRQLALELSLEAGDSARARALLDQLGVPEPEAAIDRAWAQLADGDVMASLAALAACPQDHPRVAYLQGLALVEQRRWEEAEPWLARADRMMPGRVEIEVARARVAAHTADAHTAARKLAGITEAEVYAPRAWTGLGEAYLAQGPDPKNAKAAQRALARAVEREPRPAEAMLLLGDVWRGRRLQVPEAERNALTWYEQAAETNPRLPRYREALARYLADLGESERAEAMLRDLSGEPGIDPTTPLALLELALARAGERGEPPPAEAEAWLAAAAALGAGEDALARARARLYLSEGTRASLTRAHAELGALLQRSPGDLDARVLAVRVLAARRELEDAETLLRQGFHVPGGGETGRLFYAWAEVTLKMGKRKQAALHARAAFKRLVEEQRPTAELLAAVDFATEIFLRTDQHKLALGMTRELTQALPFHPEAWRLEARAQLGAGEASKARRAIGRALTLSPDDPRALELRAQVALRTGDRKAAREALTRALELVRGESEQKRLRELLRRIPA